MLLSVLYKVVLFNILPVGQTLLVAAGQRSVTRGIDTTPDSFRRGGNA